MEDGWKACRDFVVETLDGVSFDREFGPILRRKLGILDEIDLCSVALDHHEFVVSMDYLEAEAFDEQIKPIFHLRVEHLGDEPNQHGSVFL